MKTLKQIQQHYHLSTPSQHLINTIIKEWLTQKREEYDTHCQLFIDELLEELNQ